MKTIESHEDYKQLNALPQAILFVDSRWSSMARRSRVFVERWERELVDCSLQVHLAHDDENAYLTWLNALAPVLDDAVRHNLTVGGHGTVVWLQYGSILSTTSGNVHPAMVPELSATTRELFGLDEN